MLGLSNRCIAGNALEAAASAAFAPLAGALSPVGDSLLPQLEHGLAGGKTRPFVSVLPSSNKVSPSVTGIVMYFRDDQMSKTKVV